MGIEENFDSGRLAFSSYRAYVNNTAYDGTPIPEWDDLRLEIKNAWQYAGLSVAKQSIVHLQLVMQEISGLMDTPIHLLIEQRSKPKDG